MQPLPNTQRTSCVVTLGGKIIQQHESGEGAADCIGQQIQTYIPSATWETIATQTRKHGTITLNYTAQLIGRDRTYDIQARWTQQGDRLCGVLLSARLTKSVIFVTDTCEEKPEQQGQVRQNGSSPLRVPAIKVPPMLFDTDETQAFIKAAYEVAGDLLEPNYLILPRVTYALKRDIVFICKPPFAHHASEAYERLAALDHFRFIHFHLYCRNENKKHLSPALVAYGDRALSDRLRVQSFRKSSLIMSNQIQTDAASARKWAGMSSWLENPKAQRYWDYLLRERPLVATVYLYDEHGVIEAVGSRHTFDQLNLKTENGQPAILGKTVAAFDDQIRPYRSTALQELQELREQGHADIPVTLTRPYHDAALAMEFGFGEEFHAVGDRKTLEICYYLDEAHDRYWANRAATQRKYQP